MWMTLLFDTTAAVFLAMTLVTLWHLHRVRRLPALEMFRHREMLPRHP